MYVCNPLYIYMYIYIYIYISLYIYMYIQREMPFKYGGFYNFAAFLALAFNPSDRALEGPTSSPHDALADAG